MTDSLIPQFPGPSNSFLLRREGQPWGPRAPRGELEEGKRRRVPVPPYQTDEREAVVVQFPDG